MAVVLLIVSAGGWLVLQQTGGRKVVAHFTGTVGLYPDSDVRMLGVAIGTVDAVEPDGERVRVSMTVDDDVPVPSDAVALIVTPSLVSDRYVQLAPVYRGGPQLADGAVIPVERTVVPVEMDELFSSLNDLTTALGPDGANADGALSQLLSSAAKSWGGNGKRLGETIRALGKASRTLSGTEKDLFGTVDGVQKFTTMLADNDQAVEEFDQLLADVSEVFAAERKDMTLAMRELASALTKVSDFVKDHRGAVHTSVKKLSGTAALLAKQKESLTEALQRAPQALEDLLDAYDPKAGTLDARNNLNEFSFGGGR